MKNYEIWLKMHRLRPKIQSVIQVWRWYLFRWVFGKYFIPSSKKNIGVSWHLKAKFFEKSIPMLILADLELSELFWRILMKNDEIWLKMHGLRPKIQSAIRVWGWYPFRRVFGKHFIPSSKKNIGVSWHFKAHFEIKIQNSWNCEKSWFLMKNHDFLRMWNFHLSTKSMFFQRKKQ